MTSCRALMRSPTARRRRRPASAARSSSSAVTSLRAASGRGGRRRRAALGHRLGMRFTATTHKEPSAPRRFVPPKRPPARAVGGRRVGGSGGGGSDGARRALDDDSTTCQTSRQPHGRCLTVRAAAAGRPCRFVGRAPSRRCSHHLAALVSLRDAESCSMQTGQQHVLERARSTRYHRGDRVGGRSAGSTRRPHVLLAGVCQGCGRQLAVLGADGACWPRNSFTRASSSDERLLRATATGC